MSTGVGEADRLLAELFGGVEQDPFPYYDELREIGDGIHDVAMMNAPLITRYADVKRVVSDPKTFSSDLFTVSAPGIHDPTDPEHRRFADISSRLFMFADPPWHTQVRSTLRYAFTPDATRAWRSIVEEVADESLSQFSAGDEFDLMPQLAADVPVTVIARILGVPQEQWHNFRDWSFGYASTFDPMVQGERRDDAIRRSLALFDYLGDLIDERAAQPGEDLISHMITSDTFEGDRLDRKDLIAQVALLLVAGNETTTNLIGGGLTLLFEHPDAKAALVADRELLPPAVEEMLRYDPPLHLSARRTTSEVSIGHRVIEPGTVVFVCIPSANRDPRVFDDPGTFDIRRAENRHLSFLYGIHYCVGAPLARMEGAVVFDRLLTRFPDVRPGEPPAVRRTLNIVSRGWQTRPVRL